MCNSFHHIFLFLLPQMYLCLWLWNENLNQVTALFCHPLSINRARSLSTAAIGVFPPIRKLRYISPTRAFSYYFSLLHNTNILPSYLPLIMLASISNFGNNAGMRKMVSWKRLWCWCFLAGLEKTLRLAQALSTVGASLATTLDDKGPWLLARGQFNLCMFFLPTLVFSSKNLFDWFHSVLHLFPHEQLFGYMFPAQN